MNAIGQNVKKVSQSVHELFLQTDRHREGEERVQQRPARGASGTQVTRVNAAIDTPDDDHLEVDADYAEYYMFEPGTLPLITPRNMPSSRP